VYAPEKEKKRQIKIHLNGKLKRRVRNNNVLMLMLCLLGGYIAYSHVLKPINVTINQSAPVVVSDTHDHAQPDFYAMTRAAVTLKVKALVLDQWYPTDPNGNPNFIETSWSGSGVLIDNLGTIITANHVVEGATHIVVIDYDGNEYEAEEFRGTEYTDLGIVKIRPQPPLPIVSLGLSNPRLGDTIYICGSSLGEFTNSLSIGIVGHEKRLLTDLGYTKVVFQSCASAYPGNSGGPVYDEDGLVIGILVAGVDSGLNFFVPVEQVRAMYDWYWTDKNFRDM